MNLMRHRVLGAIIAIAIAAPLGAQPPTPPATAPTAPATPPMPSFDEVNTRRNATMTAGMYEPQFADIYKMDDKQKESLKKLLAEVIDADVKYSKDNHDLRNKTSEENRKMLRDLMVARRESKDGPETKRLEGELQKMQAKFQEIQKNRPLDLDKIAAQIEKSLPAEQAKLGHVEFEKRKPYGLRPVPSTQPSVNNPMSPNPIQQGPLAPQTAQPTRFRTFKEDAPAPDKWEAAMTKVITDRKYDAEQTAKSKAVLANVRSRLDKYNAAKKADFDAANAIANAQEKESKLKELGREQHMLFDELMLRIDNIARQDQLPPVATGAPTAPIPGQPMPQPGTAATKPAAPGHEGHNHP